MNKVKDHNLGVILPTLVMVDLSVILDAFCIDSRFSRKGNPTKAHLHLAEFI